MKKILSLSIAGLLSLVLAVDPVRAVPNRITYQGRLSKSGVAVSGPHIFVVRLLSSSGGPLWSSGNIPATLPATGDFSFTLEPIGVDWPNDDPRMEITVDGEKMSPTEGFSATPYAFVAQQVVDGSVSAQKLTAGAVTNEKVAANAAIDPSKIALSGAVTLADWRSGANPAKIDANVIQGTVPVSSNQIDGTALVAHSTFTQVVEPTYPVKPLIIKPQSSTNVDILELQKENGGTAMLVKNTGDVEIAGRVSDATGFLMPVGSIVAYAGNAAPAGWRLCDGAAVSRTTYATLFTAIGTSYGGGDGSTTFNLPDLRGRVAVGRDNMGGTTANRVTAASGMAGTTLGAAGGTETTTLSLAQIPPHDHGSGYLGGQNLGAGAINYVCYSNGGISISQGSGQAHQNMPPSLIVNHIIKY
ncbi:MAG TPA: tail fiber protein [Elusimicrobiota bacterium]|nr:tail fiber protein [Elusimicrobiota bacterium]